MSYSTSGRSKLLWRTDPRPFRSSIGFKTENKHQYRGIISDTSVVEVKRSQTVACLIVLCVFLGSVIPSHASPTQKRFALAYFDVDVSYPENGKPGETITVSVTATVKKDCEVQDLSVELFAYSLSGEPRLIATISVVKQTSVVSGNSFQNYAAVSIPSDAPRSFLMAVASESVRTYSYSYSYSYYSYPYYWYGVNPTRYWWSWYPVYYSYRTYVDTVDKETGPLTYVLATTPEYIQLKADYDKLNTDYNKLSSDYSTLNSRYTKLNEEHQRSLSENENLAQALAITRIALCSFVVAVGVIAALMYLQKKGRIVVSFQPRTKK